MNSICLLESANSMNSVSSLRRGMRAKDPWQKIFGCQMYATSFFCHLEIWSYLQDEIIKIPGCQLDTTERIDRVKDQNSYLLESAYCTGTV